MSACVCAVGCGEGWVVGGGGEGYPCTWGWIGT